MIGERIGAYAIVQQIGEGGMGTVWLAEHAMLGRRAALKMLHANVSGQIDITTRFFNEARAAAAIQDPGIVHRDLKPDNVFLVRDAEVAGGERAKILDFGIAKITNGSGLKTETSVVMGTPLFMSPEQCRGAGKVDQRSDVYSLGCLLFTLLTGRPPFCGDGPGDIIAMHLREAPPIPSTLIAGIPHVVDSLILRCLEKDPARRYASGEEVAAALEGVSASPAVRALSKHDSSSAEPGPPIPPHSTTLSAYSQMASEARGDTRPPRYRGNWLLAGVTVSLLAMLIVAVVIVKGAKSGGTQEIASPRGSAEESPSSGPSVSPERPDVPAPANQPSSSPQPPPGQQAAQQKQEPGQLQKQEQPQAQQKQQPDQPQAQQKQQPDQPQAQQKQQPDQPQALPTSGAPTSKGPTPQKIAKVTPLPGKQSFSTEDTPVTSPSASGSASTTPAPDPAPPAPVAPRPEIPDVEQAKAACAVQVAKLDAFIKNSYQMKPDGVVREAKRLATSCLDRNQRRSLAAAAIRAACSLNDKATVLHFYDLAESASLRPLCLSFLDTEESGDPP